jgi:hypothetical protein
MLLVQARGILLMGASGGLRRASPGGTLRGRSSFLLVVPIVNPIELLLEVLRADSAAVLSDLLLELLQNGSLGAGGGEGFRFWHNRLPA